MTRSLFSAILLSLMLFLSSAAFANSGQLMTFYGLSDDTPVGNFYNGGALGTPNFGVTFSSNFLGLVSYANGGSGNFQPFFTIPTGATVNVPAAIFLTGNLGSTQTGVMNVNGGFSSGLNFFFTAAFSGGKTATVQIWSGANGTGTVLATLTLGSNDASCTSVIYCNWTNAGVSFNGTAQSVTFTGPANEFGIAQITINSSTTAVPEPSSIYLLGSGLVGVGLRKFRRFLPL